MGQFSDQVLHLVSGLASRAAAEQGGVISGDNPTKVNNSDPFRLWVIQVSIIIVFTQVLAIALSRMRQPRVISEVIGGVILGPSVMGHIPKFSATIFPSQSLPVLNLTATVGLVFFLFLVGLELDTRLMRRNAKAAMSISAIGLIIPFGVGAGIAIPIYDQFISEDVKKGYFVLFVAVAVGITAFPVLCRILTELRLLDTPVGVVTLSAGVGNDVVGWVLLALSVALVNAASGLTALWVLLACTGYVIFLLFPVRIAFRWLAKKTGSLDGPPTHLMMTLTFILVLGSAFFTDIIGVHAIFGGFLAGLVIPHEGGFAIALVEKLEDLVSIVFLPIYFVQSGLNTNLSTLDTGITWGYTVLICVCAFLGKFLGCGVTARLTGFSFREAGAIGTLMACKGLVELIVLNVGLQAGILNTRVFSMFVVHALVLTFITTPLTIVWYPESVRKHLGALAHDGAPPYPVDNNEDTAKTRFAVVLSRVDQLPAIMTLTNLLKRPTPNVGSMSFTSMGTDEKEKELITTSAPVSVNALRLIELTDRTSDVLKSQEADSLVHRDSIVTTFRTFGHLNHIPVSAKLSVVRRDEFPHAVSTYAQQTGSQMVIIPWNTGLSVPAPAEEAGSLISPVANSHPFEGVFSLGKHDLSTSILESHFARKVFSESPSDVALYLDRGLAVSDSGCGHHIFLPFFGGPDDRLALSFVIQLCTNPSISATIARLSKEEEHTPIDEKIDLGYNLNNTISAFPDTIYGHQSAQTRLASDTADNLAWARYTRPTSSNNASITAALKRVNFKEVASATPLKMVLNLAAAETRHTASNWKSLIVVVGRSRRMASEAHHAELKSVMSEHTHIPTEVRGTFGDVGAALVSAGNSTGLLIMQASMKSETV